jgi:hypothetical protein
MRETSWSGAKSFAVIPKDGGTLPWRHEPSIRQVNLGDYWWVTSGECRSPAESRDSTEHEQASLPSLGDL